MITTIRPRAQRLRRPPAVRVWPATAAAWPDRLVEQLRRQWGILHRYALQHPRPDPAWLDAFALRLPCTGCREHWQATVQRTPPGDAFFAWTVMVHNEVNARLGKPLLTIEAALARWGGAS